ncbi:gamma-aminobutyric acid type B receptor subunit 2-like isoform X1 [Glandiceps talaboti]
MGDIYQKQTSTKWLCLSIIFAFYITSTTGNTKTKLTLLGFVPVENTSAWSSGGIIPAIEMALDDVNNRSDILSDYELTWQWVDDKCDPGYASYLLSEHVHRKPQKIAILGGGCSIATAPVAAFSHYYNLVQLGYSTVSPQFSDKSTYPLFSRTQLSEIVSNRVRLAILEYFNWRRVAILYQNDKFFTGTVADFVTIAAKKDIKIVTALILDRHSDQGLRIVKNEDGRIIFVKSYEDHARALFCYAYHLDMYGPKYAYIIPGSYSTNWWMKEDGGINCTLNQIKTVLESAIEIVQVAQDMSNQTTTSGETFQQYESRYKAVLKRSQYKDLRYHPWHGLGYDAVWAIALALNTSVEQLSNIVFNSSNETRPSVLEDFTYENRDMAQIILGALRNTSFHGVSGYVRFDSRGDRMGNFEIRQIQDGKSVSIGIADTEVNITITHAFQWQDGLPPADGEQLHYKTLYVHDGLLISATVFASFGILLDIFFLCLNIIKRNHGFIKLSSPRMNTITLFGALLVYVSIIPFGLMSSRYLNTDNQRTTSCLVGKWFLSIGFTLGFGPMFAKTWRIHKLFMKFEVRKEPMHDKHLIIFVLMLLLVDIIVLTTWQLVDPSTTRLIEVSTEIMQRSVKGIVEIHSCSSEHIWWWVGAVCGQKGLLLIFGCFLAHETRNIQVEGLNDARQIGISIYNIMMASLVIIILNLVLHDMPTLSYLFTSLPIFLCTTITLCMMFVKKVVVVWRDPSGKQFHKRRTSEGLSPQKRNVGYIEEDSTQGDVESSNV